MMHVTYGTRALFLDDDAARTLMEYACALSNAGLSDAVALDTVDDHGNSVEATFLLNPSTVMLMESSSSGLTPPANTPATDYMQTRITRLLHPAEIGFEDHAALSDHDHDASILD